MATRELAAVLRWMRDGTKQFVEEAVAIPRDGWAEPSLLPGWSKSHVVAHVAANAEALCNLARWAATAEPTPMYASPEARAEGIAMGDRLSPDDLLAWLRRSAESLYTAIDAIASDQWTQEVRTAQGRQVEATEIPWLRAREAWVHAVDLSIGTSFGSLPTDFLIALKADIEAKRGATPAVAGPLAEVVAYLAGRPSRGVTTVGGGQPPTLSAWL